MVVISSDKCYENREWDFAYRENDPLGGHDVYSMSKAATELVAQSWQKSFFLPDPQLGSVATARAGNVIGGGDYEVPIQIIAGAFRVQGNANLSMAELPTPATRRIVALVE